MIPVAVYKVIHIIGVAFVVGALGGMVSAGIVGLFIGAVALAVGYQLFMDWVNRPDPDGPVAPEASSPPA